MSDPLSKEEAERIRPTKRMQSSTARRPWFLFAFIVGFFLAAFFLVT